VGGEAVTDLVIEYHRDVVIFPEVDEWEEIIMACTGASMEEDERPFTGGGDGSYDFVPSVTLLVYAGNVKGDCAFGC
jgi:hypothetical protein